MAQLRYYDVTSNTWLPMSAVGPQGTQGFQGAQGVSTGTSAPADTTLLWLNTASAGIGTQGPQGFQGPSGGAQGAQGATAVISQSTAPANTSVVWLDTSTSVTGIATSTYNAAYKNAVLNGAFDIWQRGTSFNPPTYAIAYNADRWCGDTRADAATNYTVSRITTSSTLPTGFQYGMRLQRTNASTAYSGCFFAQSIETANSIPLAGQTVVLSFWARAGANFASSIGVSVTTGTGTDENLFNGYAGSATPIAVGLTPTATWTRYSYTATLSSATTEIGVSFNYNAAGTVAGANDYFDITGVQLEIGTVATTFSRAAGTIQAELAACQRYYQRFSSAYQYAIVVPGMFGQSSTAGQLNFLYPVTMRTTPSSIDFSNLAWYGGGGGPTSISNVVINGSYITSQGANLTVTSTGLTNGSYYVIIQSAVGSAYLGLNAEL